METVLHPSRRLRDPEAPARTVVEAQHGGAVIVDRPFRDHVADLGGDLRDFEATDEPHQVVRVRSDVAHHQGRSASHGVVAPRQPAGWVRVGLIGLVSLHVFDLDQPDLADLPILDQRASLAHHGVARIDVREAEDQPRGIDLADDVQGLVKRVRHRLVADDVEAPIQSRQGIPMVAVVRGHDRDDLGTVLAVALGIELHIGIGIGA